MPKPILYKGQAVGLLLLLGSISPFALGFSRSSHQTMSVSTNDEGDSDRCQDHLQFHASYLQTSRAEQIIKHPNEPLKVTAPQNGGIQLTTWDRPEFEIKVCTAASGETRNEAEDLLNRIKVVNDGGQVRVLGPAADTPPWTALLRIKAPRGARIDLSAVNGGISLKKFDGYVTARTVNGGISMKESTGRISAEAENGGISITDCGGDIHTALQNGGLSLKMPEHWEGAGLEATVQNGGLSIELPKNFQSSLKVSTSNYTSLQCSYSGCDRGQKTWDDQDKVFSLGGSPAVVRVSSRNGGVVIKDRGRESEDGLF